MNQNSSNSEPRELAQEKLENVAGGINMSSFAKCEYGFTKYCNSSECGLFGTDRCVDGFYNSHWNILRRPAP